MGHKHAELMKLYAEDAAETYKPWERWECRASKRGDRWVRCPFHPEWKLGVEYRRKPQTIRINGEEVPKPVSENSYESSNFVEVRCNSGEDFDVLVFDHLDGDGAVKHYNALLKASRGE